jgi:hypothetical protein
MRLENVRPAAEHVAPPPRTISCTSLRLRPVRRTICLIGVPALAAAMTGGSV